MFRATVRANESSDVEAIIADLRTQAESAGLAGQDIDAIAQQARATLGELVKRGRELASMGSQMHVSREVTGDAYEVKLIFRAGDRRSSFQRLLDALRGR